MFGISLGSELQSGVFSWCSTNSRGDFAGGVCVILLLSLGL